MANKIDWKKVLQAGAYATDALSRGSAGGLGKAIVDSKIDLSGKPSNGPSSNGSQSGASKGATDTKSFNEQNTENAAGQRVKKYGGQGNKRKNQDNYIDG